MKNGFPGFPEEAFSFFRSLEKNNHRDWFQVHKEAFERFVHRPMVALVHAVNQELAKFAPDYIHEPERAIYRIYRDTRFSPDKTPYKTHIAAVFPKRGHQKHSCAGFYFSVSPKELEVAGGVYLPPPENLLAIRRHIAAHSDELQQILNHRRLALLMGELQGERLTRAPKGFPANHPACDLIRYKQWLFYVLLEPRIALTSRLLPEILDRFRAMLPFAEFLNRPLERKKVIVPPEELLR